MPQGPDIPTLAPPAAAKPLQLLIVDDDPNDIELCLLELKRSGIGFHAETSTTREEFARLLRDLPIDIVISDYRMRDWTGIDALSLIGETRPGTPLILLSGTLGDDLAVECIKLGVTDYVLKHQLARLPVALLRAQEERAHREAEVRALASLRESEARYRGLVNNATYGIFWVSVDGELLDVNPALVRILGYDSAADLLALKNTKALYCDPAVREDVYEEFHKNGRSSNQVE
jgi:CheY-like chemotaxis protein